MFFTQVHCSEVKSNISHEADDIPVLLPPPDTYNFPTKKLVMARNQNDLQDSIWVRADDAHLAGETYIL